MNLTAAQEGRSTGSCRPGRRRASCRRYFSTPKLASGHIGRREDLHQGISRCKSLKAPGMRSSVRREGVRPLFHRWYQPGTGRYTKSDPFFAGPVDLDFLEEGHQPLFAYAGNRPIVLIDPLGLLALPPGTDCENFNDIIRGLDQLTDNCTCTKFFADLGVDLPTLISGAPPYLQTFPTPSVRNPRRRKGFFHCERDPDNIQVAQKFCDRPFFFPGRRIRQATVVVLHELAHYADCNGNNDQFPGEEGQAAEIACFGKVLSGDVN